MSSPRGSWCLHEVDTQPTRATKMRIQTVLRDGSLPSIMNDRIIYLDQGSGEEKNHRADDERLDILNVKKHQ
jgi:hypothetical protein